MRRADFSLHVDRRKPPCVLDPALVLAHASGPALALRLGAVFEPWLTRSFWNAVDDSERLLMRGAQGQDDVSGAALTRWIALRERPDRIASVRWIGDRVAESQLYDVEDENLFENFEDLQCALEQRAERQARPAAQGLQAWCRFGASSDVLTLSASLEGALLLCRPPGEGQMPAPVQLAQRLGLRVHDAEADGGGWFAVERQCLRHALASAGLTLLVQRLAPLAIVHVGLDEEHRRKPADEEGDVLQAHALEDGGLQDGCLEDGTDPWAEATVWWYWL
jgi:hypothetical protein